MSRSHDGEVAAVERRKCGDVEPLGDSDHGRVDETDAEVGVGFE
jgi:hypothetical protein